MSTRIILALLLLTGCKKPNQYLVVYQQQTTNGYITGIRQTQGTRFATPDADWFVMDTQKLNNNTNNLIILNIIKLDNP